MGVRFILLVKATEESEAGVLPDDALMTDMLRYNEALDAAGVLVACDGVHESSTGARVTFTESGTTVTDGPFPQVAELIAGFWLLEVASRDDAVDWARRAPLRGGQIEVRKIVEPDDFCGALPPEVLAAEQRLHERMVARLAAS